MFILLLFYNSNAVCTYNPCILNYIRDVSIRHQNKISQKMELFCLQTFNKIPLHMSFFALDFAMMTLTPLNYICALMMMFM